MSDKSDILDRIDLRFDVHFECSVKKDDRNAVTVLGNILIACGTYSGIPTKENLVELINDRGIYDQDISSMTGSRRWQPSMEEAAKMIHARGITVDEIKKATIAAVMLDETDIAVSM